MVGGKSEQTFFETGIELLNNQKLGIMEGLDLTREFTPQKKPIQRNPDGLFKNYRFFRF